MVPLPRIVVISQQYINEELTDKEYRAALSLELGSCNDNELKAMARVIFFLC